MIIDSFMFNDELSVLELRLGQLDSVVDYFVFNEIGTTHSGNSKPIHYEDNKNRFSKWNHKIICTHPSFRPMGAWELETAQRKALEVSVLSLNPKPEDTLCTSDCDEIPNPDVLAQYTPSMGLRNLRQYTFWYNFGHLFDYGSRTASRARLGSIQNMIDAGGLGNFHGGPKDDMDMSFPSIENGGWHCSYFSEGIERIRRKVNSFAHTDLSPYIKSRSDKQLAEVIYYGKDLYGRKEINDSQKWEDTDPRLPPYFLQNKERFKGFTNSYFYETHRALLESADTGVGIEKPSATRLLRLDRAPRR